ERSISSVGAFFTVFSIAAVIIRPLAGILSDRWGRLIVFLPGLVIQFISALLIAKAASSGQLLLGGFLLSAGISLAFPSLMALASDLLPPEERTAGITTFTMAHDLGQTAGSFISGLLLQWLNFTELYYLFALISLLPLTLLPGLKQKASRSLPVSDSSTGES
ncbi:MAG TPA: MFS transporter, partial [Firmicutes bacterium]|nr:MFS transporter [Bacillota bacterium]